MMRSRYICILLTIYTMSSLLRNTTIENSSLVVNIPDPYQSESVFYLLSNHKYGKYIQCSNVGISIYIYIYIYIYI